MFGVAKYRSLVNSVQIFGKRKPKSMLSLATLQEQSFGTKSKNQNRNKSTKKNPSKSQGNNPPQIDFKSPTMSDPNLNYEKK